MISPAEFIQAIPSSLPPSLPRDTQRSRASESSGRSLLRLRPHPVPSARRLLLPSSGPASSASASTRWRGHWEAGAPGRARPSHTQRGEGGHERASTIATSPASVATTLASLAPRKVSPALLCNSVDSTTLRDGHRLPRFRLRIKEMPTRLASAISRPRSIALAWRRS